MGAGAGAGVRETGGDSQLQNQAGLSQEERAGWGGRGGTALLRAAVLGLSLSQALFTLKSY